MSSGYTEFLDFTGPVTKDTTFTRDGIKWNQFQPAGVIGKSLVTFTIQPFTFYPTNYITGFNWNNPLIAGQINCTSPQPFTLLDWNSIANQSIIQNDLSGILVISYRVNNNKVRYALSNASLAGANYPEFINYGYASLYNGQIIQPNFTLEAWTSFPTVGEVALTAPLTLATSILNQPQRFTPNTVVLPNLGSGAVVSDALFTPLPANLPIVLDPSGPWNNNP